uniref:Uncharacterized protein n=1 Tax=Panagrolaimus sp. ES5 TaxID=591445 RepID=A0AC34FDI2_9BILA
MLLRLSKFRLNPAFYIELIEELSKQMLENEWNFEIEFTWYGEANILNENGPEVKLFKEVFGPFLKITELDETNSKWRIEKKFSPTKSLFLDLLIRK